MKIAVVALGIACLSCTDQMVTSTSRDDAPRSHADAPSPRPDTVEEIQRKLNEANAFADGRFADLLEGEAAGPVIADARATWRRRIDDCRDDTCRTRLLSDQLNRIEYAMGRNRRPIADMPWPTGAFRFSEPTIPFGTSEGSISIWPIIDDWLLIAFTSVMVPTEQSMCRMVAEGRMHGGVIRMRSLDEDRHVFVLRPAGERHLSIDSDAPVMSHCGAFGSVTGDYEIESMQTD